MASVCIRVWAGGKFCSVGATKVGVPRRACFGIEDGVCSMGDILLVDEGWLLIDPESLMRYLDRDRFLVVVGMFY